MPLTAITLKDSYISEGSYIEKSPPFLQEEAFPKKCSSWEKYLSRKHSYEVGKVTSTDPRGDQYCSTRWPVLVDIPNQYCSLQRPVLVAKETSWGRVIARPYISYLSIR